MRVGRTALAAAHLLFVAGVARAQARPGVDLQWSAPPSCPSRDAVLAEIHRILDPLGGGRDAVAVHAEVADLAPGRWSASLRVGVRGEESQRQFETETCSSLASAVALIVAVASDPRAASVAVRASPEATVRPAPPATTAVRPIASAHAVDRGQLELMLAPALDLKLLPTVSPGAALDVGWSLWLSGWRVWVLAGGAAFAPSTATARTEERATLALATGSARACATFVADRLEVGPCAGAEVDAMWTTAVGGPASFKPLPASPRVWAMLGGSLLARVRVAPWLGAFARVDGLFAWSRPGFEVKTDSQPIEVYRVPAGAARAEIGLGARFF